MFGSNHGVLNMTAVAGKNEKFYFHLPHLAEKLNSLKKNFNSSHFCRVWLENLSFYDRRHANRNATKFKCHIVPQPNHKASNIQFKLAI